MTFKKVATPSYLFFFFFFASFFPLSRTEKPNNNFVFILLSTIVVFTWQGRRLLGKKKERGFSCFLLLNSNACRMFTTVQSTHLVVDTGGIIQGTRLERLGKELWTIPEVLDEVRDSKARALLDTMIVPLKLKEPTPADVKAGV